jgi:predicted metalloprotease with PDZ domain
MGLLDTLKSPFNKAKSMVTGPGEQPEADPMNPEARAAFNQAQAGLNKDASQIENEAMATVSPEMPSVSAGLQSAAQPMAFGGREASQALENMAQNRYKDEIQKLRIKTRDQSRRMETENRSKAFENLIEKKGTDTKSGFWNLL